MPTIIIREPFSEGNLNAALVEKAESLLKAQGHETRIIKFE